MNHIIKKILWPLLLCRRAYDYYMCKHNPERLFAIRYKRITGSPLHITKPVALYEKIAYLSFHTDTSEWSRLADKVKVRDYVADCGYGDNLPFLYGTWENASMIDFEKLPNSFVIKTNNASATNIIVKDKTKINLLEVRKQLDKWLRWEYGLLTCQPHYTRIKPLILAEELLVDDKTTKKGKSLIDYKFYCVNGLPYYVMVMADRKDNSHDFKVGIFDLNWELYPEFVSNNHEIVDPNFECPSSLQEMKAMATRLCSNFVFCRVDFYEINGKPVFGEMTFTPGFSAFSQKFQDELGRYCNINKYLNS